MKIFKMTILMVLIILFTMFFTTNISKATTVEVTTDNLNFRREASTDSEVIMAFQTGYKCELIAEEENWYKVKYLGMIGYISMQKKSKNLKKRKLMQKHQLLLIQKNLKNQMNNKQKQLVIKY